MSHASLGHALKPVLKAIVVSSLCLANLFALAFQAKATEINFSTYAAVAFSPATGHYGYAWNHWSRSRAEEVALSNCEGDDARIVGWVQGGWLVLAVGEENGYGVGWQYGNGASNAAAWQRAVDECKDRGDKVREIVQICSGNIDPVITK